MRKYNFKYLIRLCAAVLIIVMIIPTAMLSAGESITWGEENFPPVWILEGPDKGEGILDGLISIYVKNLPEYEHHHLSANMSRILSMMKEGENICHAGILKSPGRENYIHFSIPNCITNLHKIVVKKNKVNSLFANSKSVSLETLLEKTNLKLGIGKSNSYGATIDKLVEKYKEKNTILFRSGNDNHISLLRMLKEERIDYMIGYPWEISYIEKQMSFLDQFAFIDINELSGNKWLLSYVGCTKNEWGFQVIEKLDAILLRVRTSDEYLSHVFKWLPESVKPEAKIAYKERVITVTE